MAVTFNNVHIPFDASVLVPVDVLFANLSVSVVIAIDVEIVLAFTTTIVVPIGNATVPFAGIVNVWPDVVVI